MNAARTGMNVPQILTILVVLLGLALSAWLVYMIRQTLLPFGIAFFLSYVLMPLVDRLESRGMPRIAGVLVIYAGMVGLLGFTFVSFVPVLGRGISDFRDRVLGENAVWTCILTNPGASEVGISRADAPHPDFSVEGLPLLLSPGGQDTIRIHFAPNDAAARTGHISLVGTTGATTKEQVLGRVFVVANVWEATSGSSNDEQAAAFPVVPHQTLHSFGRLKPGVLSDLKAILATYQPTMAEHLPMLAEVDLADALNQRAKVWAREGWLRRLN